MRGFPTPNQPNILDPSFKMDLDILGLLWNSNPDTCPISAGISAYFKGH